MNDEAARLTYRDASWEWRGPKDAPLKERYSCHPGPLLAVPLRPSGHSLLKQVLVKPDLQPTLLSHENGFLLGHLRNQTCYDTGGVAQVVECLPCRYKDLSSISRTYANKRGRCSLLVILALKRQEGLWGPPLASQPSLDGERPCLQNTRWTASKIWHQGLSSGLQTPAHICAPTCAKEMVQIGICALDVHRQKSGVGSELYRGHRLWSHSVVLPCQQHVNTLG